MDWDNIYEHFVAKLKEMAHTLWGWFLIIANFLIDFFAGYKWAVVGVLVAVIFDAFWGIWAALRQGKYAKSELARDTVSKFAAYGGAIVICIMIEKIAGWESTFVTSTIAAVICAVELWSMSGNILIVNPKAAFFRLLKPALLGEIARKLGISESDVDKALEENEPKKKEKKKKKDTPTS